MTDRLTLPSRLDSSGAAALADMMVARRGAPLTIDASEVEVIGGLAMEVLIASGRQWDADRQALAIEAGSERYFAACATMGLHPDMPWRMPEAGGERA